MAVVTRSKIRCEEILHRERLCDISAFKHGAFRSAGIDCGHEAQGLQAGHSLRVYTPHLR